MATRTSQFKKLEAAIKGSDKAQALFAINTSNLSDTNKKYYAIKLGLITVEEAEAMATNADTVATTANTAAKGANLGITEFLTVAWIKLTIAIKNAIAYLWTFFTTTPAGWATLIMGAFAGATSCIKKYNDHLEESKQKIRAAADEAKSSVYDIKSHFDKLSSTTDDVKNRYAELAQEVENLGKSNQARGTLNIEEYEELTKFNIEASPSKTFPALYPLLL